MVAGVGQAVPAGADHRRLSPRPRGVVLSRFAVWGASAIEHGFMAFGLYATKGMDVAAVTSMVLTKIAATQVETVRNRSAVMFFSFPTAFTFAVSCR
jgi:hypothetical protein